MKLSEIKVGGRYKIRVDLNNAENKYGLNSDMYRWRGEVVTVKEIDCTVIRVVGNMWSWTADCFECEVENNNEEDNTMSTIMTKESEFVLSDEAKEKLVNVSMDLLTEYDYDPNKSPLSDIMDEWASKKGWLIDLFSKSKFYNGNYQIVIPANLKRPLDEGGILKFMNWFEHRIDETLKAKELHIGMFTMSEYREMYNKYSKICDKIWAFDAHNQVIYKGKTYKEWTSEKDRLRDIYEEHSTKNKATSFWDNETGKYIFVNREDFDERNLIYNAIDVAVTYKFENEERHIIGEKRKEKIDSFLDSTHIKARPAIGQKVTKFVGKVLKELGYNHHVNLKKEEWYDSHTGEYRSREKDMGYNYHFALLGDSINPIEYTREVVISINPNDFYSMSLGYKWSSCHTIDKEDVRGVRSNQHGGCYSGGTESYMLDESAFIVYVRPTEEEIKSIGEESLPMEVQSKMKRCMFFLGEDKLVQARVYPDGRDGGDEGLAGQLRAIVQKLISELYDTPNMWKLEKGTDACSSVVNTMSNIHYADYEEYNDCNVSYLKRINGNLNVNRINVGAYEIICPSCGELHESSDHITCNDCYASNHKYCNRCGDRISNNDDEMVEVREGVYYCCERCANNDDWVNTVDDGWHRRGECEYEESSESWYYDINDGVWIDGYWYHNEETAEEEGWAYAEVDDDWYCEDDVYILADGRTFYAPNHEEAVKVNGGWYLTPEDAMEDGWTLNEDGEWVEAA